MSGLMHGLEDHQVVDTLFRSHRFLQADLKNYQRHGEGGVWNPTLFMAHLAIADCARREVADRKVVFDVAAHDWLSRAPLPVPTQGRCEYPRGTNEEFRARAEQRVSQLKNKGESTAVKEFSEDDVAMVLAAAAEVLGKVYP